MDDPSNCSLSLANKVTSTKKMALLGVLAAAAISSNYILIGVYNVKFMDMIVFSSGFVFGSRFGGVLGVMIWLVYGTINPFGFSLPMLGATMLGEAFYGLVGGLVWRHVELRDDWSPDLRLALIGFLLTFVYDVFTTFVSAYTAGIPVQLALIVGIPFTLVHELSNTVFFAVGVPPLVQAIKRVM